MGFSIAFDPFDSCLALVGGVIIALSSSFAFMVYGRITGLSGIFYSNLTLQFDQANIWKFGFLFGLVLSALVPSVFLPNGFSLAGKTVLLFDPIPAMESHLSVSLAILAGTLVGFGTKLGSGCTSGHGVCGLPRLAPRSLVAVATFMAVGIAVSTCVRDAWFPVAQLPPPGTSSKISLSVPEIVLFIVLLISFKISIIYNAMFNIWVAVDIVVSAMLGFTFGIGLLVSGMARQSKIFSFLTLGENWDPSLMFVMMGAVGFNLMTFQYSLRILKTSLSGRGLPSFPGNIDWKLVVGAGVFGVGWGLGGLCPGPAIMNLFRSQRLLVFLVAMAGGQLMAEQLSAAKKVKSV